MQSPPTAAALSVSVRVRPFLDEDDPQTAWRIAGNAVQEVENEDGRFEFDAVHGPSATTSEVYRRQLSHIPKRVAQGLNGTVIVYGQTGSGKTHTMLGSVASEPRATDGVVGWAVRDLFAALEAELMEKPNLATVVFLSIVEVYNEQLRDLLLLSDDGSPPRAPPLTIRERPHGVYVHHALRRRVHNAKECIDTIFDRVDNRRVTAATAMNERSSRSHCIMTIDVERLFMTVIESTGEKPSNGWNKASGEDGSDASESTIMDNPPANRTVYSTLHLVDLAGSERVGKTGATGQRMIEGGQINKSLSTLVTVTQRLCERAKKPNVFVPFRDSKLTHLLKTALGGNSMTCIVACISPTISDVDESRSTLQFGTRAKLIKNMVSLNEVVDPELRVKELEGLVRILANRVAARTLSWWSAKLRLADVTKQLARVQQQMPEGCLSTASIGDRTLSAAVEPDVRAGATLEEVVAERQQLYRSFLELDGLCREVEKENMALKENVHQLEKRLGIDAHEEINTGFSGGISDGGPHSNGLPPQRDPNGSSSTPAAAQEPMEGATVPAVQQLQSRVRELEAQLLEKDAMRDAIVDTKLQRMQDLVVHLHSIATGLETELGKVITERNLLMDGVQAKKPDCKRLAKQFPSPVSFDEIVKKVKQDSVMHLKPFGHN